MNSWIWIVVAVLVIALIVVVAVAITGRQRKQAELNRRQEKAAELRTSGQEEELRAKDAAAALIEAPF